MCALAQVAQRAASMQRMWHVARLIMFANFNEILFLLTQNDVSQNDNDDNRQGNDNNLVIRSKI